MSDDSPGEAALGIGCLIIGGVLVLCVVLGWAPDGVRKWTADRDEGPAQSPRSTRLDRVRSVLANNFDLTESDVRRMDGDNLEVFVTRKDLEAVAFPDREALFTRIGSEWCPSDSNFFTRRMANSTVTFRDIKSGWIYGDYSCDTKKTNVRAPN